MAGKIWRIKIVCGGIRAGDKIKLCGINLSDGKSALAEAEATVKSIRREIGLGSEECPEAASGDIVTVDLKHCYANGKKINKNDILSTKISIGVGEKEKCGYADRVRIRLSDAGELEEKIAASLEKKSGASAKACEVSLLWFGNSVSMTAEGASRENGFTADFRLNNITLPIPSDESLRERIGYAVVKDRRFVKSMGRNRPGVHEWRYYSGEMLF